MTEQTVDEVVAAAKQPGTFNIVNVLQERSYPSVTVDVYLDETVAFKASQLQEHISELEKSASRKKAGALEIANREIETEREKLKEVIESISDSKYTFTVTGISEGKREEMLNLAIAKFPVEYDETTNPITGEVKRVEKEDERRDRLFTDLLWREQITKITAPNGDIQENLSIEDIIAMRGALPIIAFGKINEAIEKVRIASSVFLMSVDEDFLAKS